MIHHNSRTNDSREIKQIVKHTIIPSLRVEHCKTYSTGGILKGVSPSIQGSKG